MKIENINVSNINLEDNSAKLSFTLIEYTENVNVYLKSNDDEYINIFTNESNSELTYELINLRRGINTFFLKLESADEEYISEPFEVVIKADANISDINCSYTDSTGKYILDFILSGDELFKYSISINIDDKGYNQILDGQIVGNKSYEGKGLTLGNHKCKIKANDGYNEYESSEYLFEVKNYKPYLSDVAILDIKNNGNCIVCYGVNDVESTSLIHSITIDNNEETIIPTKNGDFYTYSITGLNVGKHTIFISVSDGIDKVNTTGVEIEIFQDSTNNKRMLEIAKSKYDFSYLQLKRIIETTISDDVFNYEVENEVILKCQIYYKEMYAEFNRIALMSIDTIGNTKITNAKSDLNKEINDVYGAIDTLEDTMETTFKDGILSDSEKETLKSALNLVAKEKVDIDNDYLSLYNNEDLIDKEKVKLKSAYDIFIEKHNILVTTVNDISNKTGIIDNTDKFNLDTAFENWRIALGNYRDASMVAIDAIARRKIDVGVDEVNKYWSEIILEDGGIQSRVGSLETKVDGEGGIEERLRSAEQIITTEGIKNLIKDEFYSKEVVDEKIGDVVDEKIGETLDEKINETLDEKVEGVLDEKIEGIVNEKIDEFEGINWQPSIDNLQSQITESRTEIETTKSSIAEHTTQLGNITGRVSSTETNITNIRNQLESSISKVDKMYYLSTSNTEIIGGEWTTDVPTNEDNKYLWEKMITVYRDGTTGESAPICLTSNIKGKDGESGYTIILSDEIFIVQCDIQGNPL